MYWVNVYKTSRSAGGLLTNSYYADVPPLGVSQFWDFAYGVYQFDAAWSATDTKYLAITGTPTDKVNQWPDASARLWAPQAGNLGGTRIVSNPLPWRWTLNVSIDDETGHSHPRQYHDSLSREDLDWDSKGNCVLKVPTNFLDIETSRLGIYGSTYRQWLRVGTGSAQPGNALSHRPVSLALPSGITVKNKARRAQAMILNQAVDLQAKVIGLLTASGGDLEQLFLLHSEDTGHWIRAVLRPVTTNIMGKCVALAQAHKDAEKGANGQTINQGDGWRVRFGPTGATLSGKVEFFQQKMEEDLKFLQKFQTFHDVTGDEWFQNGDAQEWFQVADDWAQYLGAFGGFDFLNPDQEGLEDMSRLDNYTPLYPDLPTKVQGLPRPTKNPKRLQEPFGLFL